MTVEAGPVVGDLVEDPAGLAEVDRVEEVAVDDRRASAPRRRASARASGDARPRSSPMRRGGSSRRPGRGASRGAGSKVIVAAAPLAAQLERRRRRAVRRRAVDQQLALALRPQAVGAHAGEAEQRVLGRDLGVARAQRRVGHVLDEQFVLEPLRVGEARPSRRRPRARPRARRGARPRTRASRASRRARRRGGRSRRRPAAGAPGYSKNVMSAPGDAVLVGIEEVVDARVVLVDGLRDQPQAEHAGVEVDVARGVAGDRGDVVDAVETHQVSAARR